MIVEVKVKTTRVIDSKTRKRTETFEVQDCSLFVEAETLVTELLCTEQRAHLLEDFEIQSLRISPIKEICSQYSGDCAFIVSLKDIFLEDNGKEKTLKYKLLLNAASHTEANSRAEELARQGYNMQIEGIKMVDNYHVLENNNSLFSGGNTETE